MDLREHLRQAVESLSDHPARVIASSMGVFWGTAALILLTASATGFREFMKAEFARFGRGALACYPSLTSSGHPGYRKGVQVELARADAAEAERETSEWIEAILPEHQSIQRVLVEARGRARRLDLSASDARYAAFRNFQLDHGRFYDEREVAAGAAVAVLGPEAAEQLFGSGSEAVARSIRVEGQSFEVIGVTRSKGRQYFNVDRPDDRLLMIPVTAAEEHLGYRKEAVSRLLAYPRKGVMPEPAKSALRTSLGPRSRFHPDDLEAVRIFDMARFTRLTDLFYAGFMTFIGIVGTITLLIAGVGTANFHLAILEERAVEIAVAKAIGARNRTVVFQTVCESLLVSGAAAALGALLALAGILVLRELPAGSFPTPLLSPLAVAVSLFATTAVAAVAATIPALRVRSIEVSVALREAT